MQQIVYNLKLFPSERERERVVLILCSMSVKFTSARLTFGGCMPPNINTG